MRPRPAVLLSRFAALAFALAVAPCAPATDATPANPVKAPTEKPFPVFGSKAPELKPTQWLQGEPVKAFEPGKLYLVGCWATLTSPAVKAVPLLNDLHRRFAPKGAVVIGVSVWEESATRVKDFIKARGDTLAFRVAFDGRDAGGTVSRRWLDDAGVNTIPYLYAVRDGRILWHGEPADFESGDVPAMIDGTYDPAKAEAAYIAMREARAKAEPIFSRIDDLREEKKYDEALVLCDKLEKTLPARDRPLADAMRAEVHYAKDDFKAGYAATARYADAHANEPETQAMIALALVTEPRFKGRQNFALALRCADRALAGAPVDPYRMLRARILYESGEYTAAEKLLAALKTSENSAVRTHLELILPEVAARKPWPIPPTQDCACGAH